VELGGSLVPIVSAWPAMVASVGHKSLLYEIKLNGTMRFLCTRVLHSDERTYQACGVKLSHAEIAVSWDDNPVQATLIR